MQRTDRGSAQAKLVRRTRLRESIIGIEKRPGLNLRIHFPNTRKASLDQLFRGNDTIADQSG